MHTLLAATALTIVAGSAMAADTPRDKKNSVAVMTAGLVAGKPLSCLPTLTQSDLSADGANLIYRVSRSLVYVNRTAGGCENVARGDALVAVSPEGRLCRGDIARTVDQVSRIPTGSCALGDFVPYTKTGS